MFQNYNVMGVAKAALEACVRYLAADLGPKGIRVNAISAGPIKTLAAAGISGFSSILGVYRERAPLRRTVETAEVADAALFLLSTGRPRRHRRSADGRRRVSRHRHVRTVRQPRLNAIPRAEADCDDEATARYPAMLALLVILLAPLLAAALRQVRRRDD